MSRPESNHRLLDRASTDTRLASSARSRVAASLLMGLGCFAQRDLSSYSDGTAPEESASLVSPPAEGPASPGAAPDEAAPAATDGAATAATDTAAMDTAAMDTAAMDTAAMDTASVDETGSADAPLAPAPTNAAEPAASPASSDPSPTPPEPSDATPVTPPPGASASSSCTAAGEFTIPGGDSCYMLGADAFGWQDARDMCQAWGGDLVALDSPEENRELAQRIDANVWIGATDQDAEGTFTWADGTPLRFTRWAADQPNNLEGNENCSELRPFDGRWGDVPCTGDIARQALCERR